MKSYIVNTQPLSTGEHEVHAYDCERLPKREHQKPLGFHTSSIEAVEEAKKYFSNVDECLFCSDDYHTS